MPPNRESIRISFRLKQKDRDIMSAFLAYHVHNVISFAVERYLHHTPGTLPIPPFEPVDEVMYRAITVYKDTEPELYQFFSSVSRGSRCEVSKRLIRHAMETCDIREFLESHKAQEAPSNMAQESLSPTTKPDVPFSTVPRKKKRRKKKRRNKPAESLASSLPQENKAVPPIAYPKTEKGLPQIAQAPIAHDEDDNILDLI